MDPVSLALAKAAVQEHADRADNPHQVTAAQVGAITAVGGISNPGGNVDIVGGAAVSITRDAVNKRLIIDVDADGVVPGPHASTHAAGGSDEITPAMIGAAAATHQHAADDVTSGVFPVARGGTGLSSLTAGSYLRAATTSAFELRTPAQVLSDIGAAPASHSHSWNEITGKPSTFPPSSHTHDEHPIRVGGASRIFVQSSTPSGASVGDIWIKTG